jgi:hypothetical protein
MVRAGVCVVPSRRDVFEPSDAVIVGPNTRSILLLRLGFALARPVSPVNITWRAVGAIT